MLIDIESGKEITYVPHPQTFNPLQTCLSPKEFDDIVVHINELIENAGGEIVTAGWLPGSDWSGTPFLPIYETTAKRNQDLAGKMFGLMVWYTVMKRPERWGFGRFEKDGREIGSMTYFRLG